MVGVAAMSTQHTSLLSLLPFLPSQGIAVVFPFFWETLGKGWDSAFVELLVFKDELSPNTVTASLGTASTHTEASDTLLTAMGKPA